MNVEIKFTIPMKLERALQASASVFCFLCGFSSPVRPRIVEVKREIAQKTECKMF